MEIDASQSDQAGRARMVVSKDAVAGVLFIAIGFAFATAVLTTLDIGTARRMGPGFFPLVVSVLLLVLGCAIAANSSPRRVDAEPLGKGSFARFLPAAGIVAAPLVFAIWVRELGFFPSVTLTVLLGSFSAIGWRPLKVAVATIILAGLCCVLFLYGLGLPIPLLGPWITR